MEPWPRFPRSSPRLIDRGSIGIENRSEPSVPWRDCVRPSYPPDWSPSCSNGRSWIVALCSFVSPLPPAPTPTPTPRFSGYEEGGCDDVDFRGGGSLRIRKRQDQRMHDRQRGGLTSHPKLSTLLKSPGAYRVPDTSIVVSTSTAGL